MRSFVVALGIWVALGATTINAEQAHPTALVTLDQALAHMNDKQFELASKELRILADAGITGAYLALGSMAYNHVGPNSGYGEALGWFMAAEDLGVKITDASVATLKEAVTPSQRETAEKMIAEYGKAATTQKLLDAIHPASACSESKEQIAEREDPGVVQAKKIKFYDQNIDKFYPNGAGIEGKQGIVLISALIDSDGRAKDVRIDSIVPFQDDVGFSEAATKLLQENTAFEPASLQGKYVPRRFKMKFRFGFPESEFWNKKSLKKISKQANDGNAAAQLVVAYLGILDNQAAKILNIAGCDDEKRMAISSALAGAGESSFWLSRWLSDSPNPKAAQFSDAWLRQAAKHEYPRANLQLALQSLEFSDAAEHAHDIKVQLIKAADSKDRYARQRAAFVLSTARVPEVRDSSKALAVATTLNSEQDSNPELDEVLAAAQAGVGQFAEAAKTQERAIKKAKLLSWNTAPLEDTLTIYRISQAPKNLDGYLSWSDNKVNYRDAFN